MPDLEKENIIKNTKNFTPYGTNLFKDGMVKSDYWAVRKAIANQGYGLDILVNDKHWRVRRVVAKQGYGLDILINDKDCGVRRAVLNYLKDNNLTLAEWCNQNNKEIDLKNLAYSPYPEARVAAIKSGYVYKENEIYIGPDCKFTLYGTNPEKDKMIKSNNWRDRYKIAKQGYGLDVLINDEYCDVRTVVADQGYGLNILVNDESEYIREAVVNQGYGLDILVNDEHWGVRKAVEYYLTSHNLTLEQWKSNQDPSELSVSISKAEEFNSLDIYTLKSEIQNLKDQINILIKESKSLKETLENYTSLEKGNDEKEL